MKKNIISVALLLIVALFVTNILFPCILPYEPMLSEERYKNKPILSDDEINELRKVYKRNNDGLERLPNHQIVNIKNPDRRRITSNDSYVYFEVLSKPILDYESYSYYYMPVRVIADSENLFIPNSEVILSTSTADTLVLDFEKGKKYILPINVRYRNKFGILSTNYLGYYVTDDGYCLSVFPEYDCQLTGHNLPDTLKSLKKTDSESETYLSNRVGFFEYYGIKNYEDFKNTIRFKFTALSREWYEKSLEKFNK